MNTNMNSKGRSAEDEEHDRKKGRPRASARGISKVRPIGARRVERK